MCLLIFKPEKIRIPEAVLKQSFENNKDGAGFMYVKRGGIRILKGLMTFDDFMKHYKRVESKRVVIHFRVGNKGKVNKQNTHPHRISKEIAFAHNGTIDITPLSGDNSDTVEFCQRVLRRVPKEFLHIPELMTLVQGYVKKSRLVFMDNEANVTILNEDLGEWVDGVWYSNDSYKKKVAITTTSGSYYGSNVSPQRYDHLGYGSQTCRICRSPLDYTATKKSGYCIKCLQIVGCPNCHHSHINVDTENSSFLHLGKAEWDWWINRYKSTTGVDDLEVVCKRCDKPATALYNKPEE